MYTELIFGAALEKDTPKNIIDNFIWFIEHKNEPMEIIEEIENMLYRGTSSYFAIHNPVNKILFDTFYGRYAVSIRMNIKNYGGEIETFLDYIKPYIHQGSGNRDMYAIVMYEEEDTPTIYYLGEE